MQVSEIFEIAMRLSGSDQTRFLDGICAYDLALRKEVEALLHAHQESGTFLADRSHVEPPDRSLDATIDSHTRESRGMLIAGKYKLLEAIGEGGMGSVWLAEQSIPVKRKVAIKLIKAGMDSRQVVARFEAERQALALMDHPNIAKVFDGGMTDQGRPYFVMEYVKGIPLTDYCDQARLTVRDRLGLFTSVCQAVQHAHQKGIIHRDLKPSNILACLYDGVPVPKVIDFGLAKAMHQSLTDHSLHTLHGVAVGTPLYMSPEQAEHNNLDIDTRADIYSLGVILYELLTGTTPLEKQQVKQAAWNEILRLIKDVEPPKPSTRLSGSANLPSVAAQRSIDPTQLRKSLIGDLDWIVMKSLEKARSRRYETANALARDLQRCLANEPIEARPPSTTYRFRKFVVRHKTTFALVTAIFASVLLASVVSTYWAWEAQRQKTNAQANLTDAITQRGLADEAKNRYLQERDSARKAYDQARSALDEISSEVIQEWLAGLPELSTKQVDFLKRVAMQYESITANSDTESQQQLTLGVGYLRLANIYSMLGKQPESSDSIERAVATLQPLVQSKPNELPVRIAYCEALYGRFTAVMSNWKGVATDQIAEAGWQEVERLAAEFPDEDRCRRLRVDFANSYATFLMYSGRNTLALELQERSTDDIDALIRKNPDDQQVQLERIRSLSTRSAILGRLGKPGEALVLLLEAIKAADVLAEKYPDIPDCLSSAARNHQNLSISLKNDNKLPEAEAEISIAIRFQSELAMRFPSAVSFRTALGQSQLVQTDILLNINELERGLLAAGDAVATWQTLVRMSNGAHGVQGLAAAHICQARALNLTGNPEAALPIFADAIRDNQSIVNGDPRNRYAVIDRRNAFVHRAEAYRALGRFDEALQDQLSVIDTESMLEQRVASSFVQLCHDFAHARQAETALKQIRETADELPDELAKKYLIGLARDACIAANSAESSATSKALLDQAVSMLVRLKRIQGDIATEALAGDEFGPIRSNPKFQTLMKSPTP